MENMMKTVLVLVLVGGLAMPSLAQQRSNRMMQDRPMQFHRQGGQMMNLPDLTDEQRTQIRNIMLNTRKEMLPIQNELREKQAQLRTLTTGENIDMEAANTVIEEIGALRTKMMKNRITSRQEIRNLLTEEQRIIFDSRTPMKGQVRRHMRQHRQ